MFGYIRPLESELKVREQAEYHAYYCGLCRSIGRRYGQLERLSLSYECAFLAAFMSALMEREPAFEPLRCTPRFYRGRRYMAKPSPVLDYAADVNVLLAWHKLGDDVRDGGGAKARLIRVGLKRAYKRASGLHPALDEALCKSMRALHEIEQAKVTSTDAPSEAFGRFLAAIALHAPMLPASERAACEWMFFNVGKWLYLLDAWDDLEKDASGDGYNPFLLGGMDAEQARFLMNVALTEAEKGYDLVSLCRKSGLVDNVMRLGLREVTRRVMEKKSEHTDKGEIG